MKRTLFLSLAALVLATLAAPELHAQRACGKGRGTCQGQQLRKRDGSCTTPCQGQGVRKQDGTGPRGGTAACPLTPKAPAKAEPKK